MAAVSGGNLYMVQLLLLHGASIDAIGTKGSTCLMLAVEKHRAAIVKTLVLEGANVHIRDQMGRTAMAIADEQPRKNIAALLKQRPSPLSGAVLQSSMQVWAQHHDGVAKQVVLTRCGRLVVMNQTHASDVEAHLSSNRSTLEFLILRRLGCDMNTKYIAITCKGDLGRVELYAETVELHKQWLKHLLIAAGPDEALLVEAGCSHLVETASANKLAESQAGDEKEYGLPAIMRVMPQEDDVFQAVSQLSQVHNVLATDVSAAAELAQSGHLVDAKLADFGRKVAACQKTMEFCKTEIRGKLAEQPGFGAVPDLQSVDILHMTAGQLQGDDPQREQRQSEMLIRDVKKQQDEASLQQQQKTTARDAIKNEFKHTEQQKDLTKSLLRAKFELEMLVLDDKHHEASKVQARITALLAEKAALANTMEANA
ncbi:hypothetical protein WJX82_000824 [Trebouxia sp. C0006]